MKILKHIMIISLCFSLFSCLGRSNNSQTGTAQEPPLEIMDIKTGYYNDYFPMIIVKVKNASGQSFNERVKFRAVFYRGDEEIGQVYGYFHEPITDVPWEPGISKQTDMTTTKIDFSRTPLSKRGVSCRLYSGNKYKGTFDIDNQVLVSNRI